jgi:hypothetical protein
MSEWYRIEKAEDVTISDDHKTIECLFDSTEWGNRYIDIPIEFILGAYLDLLKGET